jgi:hypothetical protein
MNPRGLALGVALEHERLGIVDEHGLRDATEVTKRIGQALSPVVVTLAEKCLHVLAPRVTKHGDEQHHARALLAEPHPFFAEIDLQLMARRRLESHGRDLGGTLGLAVRLHDALHRPRMHRDALLSEQIGDDNRIALSRRCKQLHGLCVLLGRQRSCRWPCLRLGGGAAHVALHGLARDAELAGDAPTAPPQRCERSDLTHGLCLDHRHLDALGWRVLQTRCVHVALDAGRSRRCGWTTFAVV